MVFRATSDMVEVRETGVYVRAFVFLRFDKAKVVEGDMLDDVLIAEHGYTMVIKVDATAVKVPKTKYPVNALSFNMRLYPKITRINSVYTINYDENCDIDEALQVCEQIKKINGDVHLNFGKCPTQDDLH